MFLQRLASVTALFASAAIGGINWTAVWLEPRTEVSLAVGQKKPYTVMGLNGADVKAELTKSPYLKIVSSDPEVLEIDKGNSTFIGKKPGHVEIRFSFSEARAVAQAVVRESNGNR